jgi:ubiquinone/menaquinone biosynthesis C-methylase UbiE
MERKAYLRMEERIFSIDAMSTKYDTIGKTYNLTRKADPYLLQRLLHHLDPKPKGLYLEIGCGSGNYSNELAKKGIQLIGIDPSSEMLQKAKLKNPNIDWRIGTAENIELPNNSIDGVVAFLTIHHWTDLQKAFFELSRVLKSDGSLVIFTSTPKQMETYWLKEYFPIMIKESIALMPSEERISDILERAGMQLTGAEKYFVKDDLKDQFLQCGKYQPELYFKPEVRADISSFAAVANKEEVETGLSKLRAAITSGKIDQHIKDYESDEGDYLYIIARKKQSL